MWHLIENGVSVQKQSTRGDAGTWVNSDDPDVTVGFLYEGGEFSAPVMVVSAYDVKMEANRRILAICPEWRQRNLTAQAVILQDKGRENWTNDELAAWNAGETLWGSIAAIRAKSDEIEAMNTIPVDYKNDSYWS